MLDLMLFLGRQPITEVKPGEQLDPQQCYYGSVPSSLLDSLLEDIRSKVNSNIELVMLLKRCISLIFKEYIATFVR